MTTINNTYSPKSSFIKLTFVTIGVGIGSGIIGTSLALLLHYIQHIAFDYSPGHIISRESFFQGVSASSAGRIVLVLSFCGMIAGVGWFLLYKYSQPLISIAESIKHNKRMPAIATIGHIFLQMALKIFHLTTALDSIDPVSLS